MTPRKPRRPRRPPVRPHRFEPDGIADAGSVQGCKRCPLPASRADVHITTEVPAQAAVIDARILGEPLEGDM